MPQTEYDPRWDEPANLTDVHGFESAARRVSHTTEDGALRLDPIEGVRYRLARPVSHYHGHLTEIYREDWGLTNAALVQVTDVSGSHPGLGPPPFHDRPAVCCDGIAPDHLLRWAAGLAHLQVHQ